MATKVVISGGEFQDASGNALVGATLVLQLSQDAVISGTCQVVSNEPISITLGTGGAAPNTSLWGNDVLSTAGTVYIARLFDVSGRMAWTGPQAWSITGAGPIELNTLVPASSAISYSGAVVLAPG